ncbi:site-specific integrase [Azospirillum oryzae]|uniref:Site-specific integrase n=1 Tax=Azospirillum oryzae TaxID=286727 RepID=A0A6N1ANA7_9PROT|nr:site-specific integrase [Azospirillum oryzae]KAA0590565.1 site-specific integrase [Azospirillum oryzae]QKS52929.1 site-specific integrase [Azospirillum oryzae]GLR80129.1 integrase [Azospirillum oryzae]
MAGKKSGTGIPNVIWKGNRLHYKRRWPTDVRRLHPEMKEFWEEALGTSDLKVALSKASELNLRFDAQAERLRGPSPVEQAKQRLRQRSFNERDRFKYGVESVLGPELKVPAELLDGGAFLLSNPSDYRIRPNEARSIERVVERFGMLAKDLAIPVPEGAKANRVQEFEAWKAKCIADAKQLVELLRAVEIEPESLGVELPEKLTEKKKSFTLLQVAEKWGAANAAPQQHIDQYKYACKLFTDLYGAKDVDSITALQISEFREKLVDMPNSTRKEIRSADMATAIERGRELNLPKISPTTVNKHMSAVKTIIKWGWEHGYVENNVGERIRVKRLRVKQARRDFKKDELQALISKVSEVLSPNSDDFWIPIVALLHGARREEVCQLEKADVQNVDGIWCMNIRVLSDSDDEDAEEKSLKTANSRRLMPIHDCALRMGFVAYAHSSKSSRVFHSLSQDSRGDFGGAYGKRFARLLREKVKITDKKVVFHSLRHSFITACRNADMPETMEHTLSGHSGSSVVHDGYGSKQEVPNRKRWLDKVDFAVPALSELVELMEKTRKSSAA